MEEIWKDIPGTYGYYQVSNLGNARSLDRPVYMQHSSRSYWCTKRGKMLNPSMNGPRRELDINMQDPQDILNYLQFSFNVDRLVYQLFIDSSISDSTPIFHIDGNYSNDRVDNLSLVSKYVVSTDDPDEIWKAVHIDSVSNKYQVSNKGNVRSLEWVTIQGSISPSIMCSPYITEDGYSSVYFSDNGNSIAVLVHQLVATAFLPNPENKPCVNHKDFNPSNNDVSNLEWCTQTENIKYSVDRKRYHGPKTITEKFILARPRKPVRCVQTGEIFRSMTYASQCFGWYDNCVSDLIKYNRSKDGFTFEIVDKEVV